MEYSHCLLSKREGFGTASEGSGRWRSAYAVRRGGMGERTSLMSEESMHYVRVDLMIK